MTTHALAAAYSCMRVDISIVYIMCVHGVRRYGTIPGGVLNLLAAYNCMKAIFGDPTGGGGGTTPIDCTAQSVPECVLASSGEQGVL